MKKTRMKSTFLIPVLGCVLSLTSGCSWLFSGLGGIGGDSGRPLRVQGNPVMGEVYIAEGSQWAKGQRPDSSQLDESTRTALELCGFMMLVENMRLFLRFPVSLGSSP